jgi:hypothetical protein
MNEDPFDELKRDVQSQLSSGPPYRGSLTQDLNDLQHTIDVARRNPVYLLLNTNFIG